MSMIHDLPLNEITDRRNFNNTSRQRNTRNMDDVGESSDHREETLQTLFGLETLPAYQRRDYLGLRQCHENLNESRRGKSMIDENINASLKVAQFPSSARTWAMTAQSRWQICEWYYQMTESYNFSPEIAMISMNYLDRILSICENVPDSKDDVQLLALTCFYLAVKLFQSGPVLSTSHMAQISGGCYTAKQISNMEQKVLFILEWRLHSPCATDFFRQFYGVILRNLGSCLPIDIRQRVSEMACTVIQASILDYFFVANPIRPSHLAAASLLLSLKIFLPHSANIQDIFHRLNQLTGNRLDFDHVALCCRRLSFIVYDHAQLKTSSLVFYTSTTLSCLEQTMPMVSPYVYKPRGV